MNPSHPVTTRKDEGMICQKCKAEIKFSLTKDTVGEAKKLHKQGYSLREIENILRSKRHQVSFSTIGRILRKTDTRKEGE